MAIPSGLGATIGFAEEVTVGSYVTPTRWIPFEKESVKLKKKTYQSKALSAGQLYMRSDRRALVGLTVDGQYSFDLTDRQLGVFFKHMLGSVITAPTLVNPSTTVYKSVYGPASDLGIGLSMQIGRPDTAGTMRAFSYNGGKITEWEIAVAKQEIAKLSLTMDAWNETTATGYTASSFVVSNALNFTQGALLLGGTASTGAGVTTVSGASTVVPVMSASVKQAQKLDVERYYLGTTTKAEQIPNEFREISGDFELEFENLTDVYTAFAADTPTALQLTFTGPLIDVANSLHSSVQVLIPNVRFDDGVPEVSGPKVLSVKVPYTGLYDGTNNQIQITYQTLDAAI